MQSKTTSILIGGLSCALLSTFIQIGSTTFNPAGQNPLLGAVFGCLGCIVGLTSGLIAVWHFTGEYELTLTRGEGIKLGALAGLVSAFVGWMMVQALMVLNVMPSAEDVVELMMENPALDNPEANMDMVIQWIEISMGWGGLAIALIFGPVLGLLGGMIGAAMFKKGDSDELGAVASDE